MSIPTCGVTTNVIEELPNKPVTDGGLTPTQFKQKFDQAVTNIKAYINNTLIPALQEKIVVNGIVKSNGSGTFTKAVAGTDYQAPLTAGVDYQTPIASGGVSSSMLADGAVVEAKVGSGAITESKIGAGAVTEGKLANGSVSYAKLTGMEERVRRIFYGTTDAAAYYTAHGLTAQTGDVYVKISS